MPPDSMTASFEAAGHSERARRWAVPPMLPQAEVSRKKVGYEIASLIAFMSSIDKAGRVTIRVFRPNDLNREGKGSRRMQIRATHLASRRPAPSLSAAGASAAYVGSQAPASRP
ncbi:unnamed protein product [Symbiodinium sp. CCMP2592]|nr:unnamed protein product [Symbiodinium sp. CCMP2592]